MTPIDPVAPRWTIAFALALGSAVSLGLARFSYALLLPPMRADLGWSYFTAGAMNTVNAAGYLIGALWAPRWLARHDARRVFVAGMLAAAALLAAHGVAASDSMLYVLRGATGVASAATFIAGGLLAARLGAAVATHGGARASLVVGIYYAGTGAGIVASTLLVPLAAVLVQHAGWRAAWIGLGLLALPAALLAWRRSAALRASPQAGAAHGGARWRQLAFGLLGYLMFGLGYIGYMTFVITLLRERGLGDREVGAFYLLLGAGVMLSPWLWSGLLQRFADGRPLALLNALLAIATVLPVASSAPLAVYVSGALFGAVFLSVVAATTALVRHNLPPPAWPAGIAAFTIIFAAGQIVGPSVVGLIADGPGGLARGFVVSAVLLALGALLALGQRALPRQA